jgi:hypothetical protein
MDVRYIEYRINEVNEQTYLVIISIKGQDIKTLELTKSEINSLHKKIFKIKEEIGK